MRRLHHCLATAGFVALSIAAPQGPNVADPNALLQLAHCDEEDTRIVQAAWTATQLVLLQATAGLHGQLSRVFMNGDILKDGTQIPRLLKDINDQKPVTSKSGTKKPLVICARGDVFEKHYPQIPARLASGCLDPADPKVYLAERTLESTIFFCMEKFVRLPIAQDSSQPERCPAVVGNTFRESQEGFRRYQITAFIKTMIFLYLPKSAIDRFDSFSWLNKLVSHRKEPSVLHLAFYIYMLYSHCRDFPNVDQPPWTEDTVCRFAKEPEQSGISSSSDFGDSISGDTTEDGSALDLGGNAQCGQEDIVFSA